MQKLILTLISSWLMVQPLISDKNLIKKEQLHWMTLQEAETAMLKERRPMLIDLYTSWCGWCKVMDKKTYSNKQVIDYVQDKFYPVRINAETQENLNWGNKLYGFNSQYRANDLAVYLTYGQLSFPTTVFIPTDGSGPQPIAGYQNPRDFELIVKYFGEGRYGKESFEQYQQAFKASW